MARAIGSMIGEQLQSMHQEQLQAIQQMNSYNQARQQQNMGAPASILQYSQIPGSAPIYIKPETKKRGIMKLFKDYLEAHRDLIFTLVLILLADHFVFKGAFSETIKAAFSKLLHQAHKKIDEKIEAKVVGAT